MKRDDTGRRRKYTEAKQSCRAEKRGAGCCLLSAVSTGCVIYGTGRKREHLVRDSVGRQHTELQNSPQPGNGEEAPRAERSGPPLEKRKKAIIKSATKKADPGPSLLCSMGEYVILARLLKLPSILKLKLVYIPYMRCTCDM